MMRCLQLAKNGLGKTYPNPLVGSVIVHDDIIIGEGWHEKAGKEHAEVVAVKNVQNKSLLSEATIYINLEPCSHFGKTPPCADLIISSGIKNVVIGSQDPNPKVTGNGINKLIKNEHNVIVGICENASLELNKRFFSYHQKKRPYIFLKWAQSVDGFIAPKETQRATIKSPVWITNSFSRQLVHKMRSEEEAILIGTKTALMDNPSLTTRDWEGYSPLRLVLDRNLIISESSIIMDDTNKTIVLTSVHKENTENIEFENIDFDKDISNQIVNALYRRNVQSLIVEGGTQTIQTFIDSNIWDEAVIFTGDQEIKNGVLAPKLNETVLYQNKVKDDKIEHYKNNSH